MHKNDGVNWIRSNFNLDSDEAKEIFQASIITLYDNVITGKLVELNADIKSYLFGICKYKSLEYKRRKGKLNIFETDTLYYEQYENQIEEKLKFENQIEQVNKAMQSIGDPCKSILQLYYYKKLSMTAICELLGYKNADTVKNQKYKCLKRLQKTLYNTYKWEV